MRNIKTFICRFFLLLLGAWRTYEVVNAKGNLPYFSIIFWIYLTTLIISDLEFSHQTYLILIFANKKIVNVLKNYRAVKRLLE